MKPSLKEMHWCLLFTFVLLLDCSSSDDPFKCPEQFGYYPDLQDCSKYYVCVFGDSLHEKCTGGLFFSIELQTCDWPRNVECANGEKPGERPVADFEIDEEFFSSSRRTSATATGGRSRPPNPEPVSNFQSSDNESRDYSRSRSQENQRSRSTSSVAARSGTSAKQQTTTLPPPAKQNSNPTTLPDSNHPSTIPEDPLYLSDERSKVSDPLGNYDPQQPDFDEAAPPLVDSEGGIHIADGGHGLDAFAGLAHLPGLGDYSVIAKPIYNANSGSSDHLPANDDDYSPRKPSLARGQEQTSTKPRRLENFQSNNGRSKDPDVVIDYGNGNKNLPWDRPNSPKEFGTPPPTIFDDTAGHRDYGGFDVITPLKTNIQADHEPSITTVADKDNLYKQHKSQNMGANGAVRDTQRLPADNARINSGRNNDRSYTNPASVNSQRDSEESDRSLHPDKSESGEAKEEFSRLQRTNFNPNENRNTYSSYSESEEIDGNSDKIPNSFSNSKNSETSEEGNRKFSSSVNDGSVMETGEPFENLRTSDNNNQNAPHGTDRQDSSARHQNSKSEETLYRRQLEEERLRKDNANPKDDSPINIEAFDFGVYTGNQRQNRKLDIESIPNQNVEDSKGIIPAESIQPAVRQPNQIKNENDQKEKNRKNENFPDTDPNYRDEYDQMPHGYGTYDSPKPEYTDDYYTNQDQETTPRSTTSIRARPTRRRPITTTTTTTTTTTQSSIRLRSRRPIGSITVPTKQPSQNVTPAASSPQRPVPLFPTPLPFTPAQKCDPRKCKAPDCRCGGTEKPVNLSHNDTPQLVLITFDDAVNELNHDLYDELFNSGRANPNGCPILGTFYVSHEWTDYGQVQTLYSQGHEIGSHSITHSYGEKFSKNQWVREIQGQREILHLYGGVRMEDIRGMRAPFLQIGGNKMFEMLYDANFTYDSSMPVYENNPPFWPYTLDYALNHECMIFPCPTKSYPGLWEIGMVMWVDLRGGRCSMGDACSNPSDEEEVSKMLMKNFNRHYNTNRAPFGLFYHSAWFNTQHHRRGFMNFLDEILKKDDVYLVTNWQLIQWMRDPTPVSKLKNFEPFDCRRLQRPPPCPTPTVCHVWYQGGVRYMKTCQPCPLKYPWMGSTGYETKKQRLNV